MSEPHQPQRPPARQRAALRRLLSIRIGAFRAPIAVVLVFGFALLVVAAVASVLGLALQAGIQNTNELARDRANLIVDLAFDRVRQRLEPVRSQADYLTDVIIRQGIDPLHDPHWLEVAGGALAATPQVAAINWYTADLEVVRVYRDSRTGYGSLREHEESPAAPAAQREALLAREPYWGEIFWSEDRKQPFINLRAPVRAAGGIRGVLVIAVSVAELSGALSEVGSEIGATSFILLDRRLVVAHPKLARDFGMRSATQPLPSLDDIGDTVLASIWDKGRLIDRQRSNAIFAGTGHVAVLDGQTWSFVYRETTRFGPEPWLIGTYMREYTLDDAFDRIWFAIIAGVVILLVAMLAAILFGRWLTRRLREFSKAAGRINELEFAEVRHVRRSRVRELDETALAFNAMLDGLKWFESYVPRTLVRRLMRQGGQGGIESIEREVTVMFTDIAGFTSLSETMTAAETAAFLNAHFGLVGAAIEAEDGTVDKHMGDGVMAFWGAPEAVGDHALRACRAAVIVRAAIVDENARRQALGLAPVHCRIGIHTGPATVGNIGAASRLSYTIVGDTVNSASRLCEMGKTVGHAEQDVVILLGGATAREAAASFVLESLGAHVLRGRHGDTEVFQLLAPVPGAAGNHIAAGAPKVAVPAAMS